MFYKDSALARIPNKLWPLLAVNLVAALSFSLVIPFLWVMTKKYGGNAFVYGILGATFWIIDTERPQSSCSSIE